eukprot:15256140-Ditylum_brightwellii.AAC.1
MRMVPTSTQQSNPGVKRSEIAFPRLIPRRLEYGQFYTYKLLLKGQNVTQGPPSYAAAKTLLKGDTLTVIKQADIACGNQTVPHFKLCLDDVAEQVFPEKAGQIQKHYMQRNVRYDKEFTIKEWVAQVTELNSYLKDFSIHNGNLTQPLNVDELLDILEFGVPARWRREFTVQGFDPVDQGLRKFVEFYTRLELCESSMGKPKGKKLSKPKTAGKRKANVLTTSTTSLPGQKLFYCKMHGRNRTHNTGACFE